MHDEIIKMAWKAGASVTGYYPVVTYSATLESLERFAELVRQARDRELLAGSGEAVAKVAGAPHALRERLAQPEHEHVIDCPRCGHCCP